MSETLGQWIDRVLPYAATAMQRAISPVGLVKERPGFGQRIAAVRGAVVASPVLASYDPDPDYFFHWFRDSAVVMDGLRLLYQDGRVGPQALQQLGDFVRFSLALQRLDGGERVRDSAWRAAVTPSFQQYLRNDDDLAAAHGDRIVAETRVNPDGTLDISRWNRPQHDGAPLRALTLLHWARSAVLDADTAADLARLLVADLDFTQGHWREPSYDIWEEDFGQHYYTLRVSAAALDEGSRWLQARGDGARALRCAADAAAILDRLDGYWLPAEGYYRSRVLDSGERTVKELDIAVILSAVHAEGQGTRHTVADPRQHATLDRLDALFEARYVINRGRPSGRGPAMGRYEGDVYYSGGAYFFSSFGAAEFCYRAAACLPEARRWAARGDAYLETARAYTLPTGELSEQFDQHSGAQTSARHLAWSYAALISCAAARRRLGLPA